MKDNVPHTDNYKLDHAFEIPQQIHSEMSTIQGGLFRFESDREYEKLLKNKRVAVVGPARTLIGSKQGRFIDSHDVVVRFNDAIEQLPVSSSLSDDIGTKADILYCNQVILRKSILQQGISHKQFARICHEVGIQYLVCTNNSLSFDKKGSPSPTCDRRDEHIVSDFKNFLVHHRIKLGFRIVYTASEMLIRWMNGNFGRTGFVAILDLLHFDIRSLYVTGMTFYHGGGHLFSTSSSELHPLKNRDGTWARDNSGLGHNSYMELELMKLMAQCFQNKLEVDKDLASLLHNGG